MQHAVGQATAETTQELDYIICDGWAVMGPTGAQRQHAVTLSVDEQGVEWAEFMCGAGNAVRLVPNRKTAGKRVLRKPANLHAYDRHGLLEGRPVCEQRWCQMRYRDFLEHSEEYRAVRAAEDARIAAQMPIARRQLLDLERRLALL